MTIEFKQKQIEKKEERIRKPYVGYFSPSGELIDFNQLFGRRGHGEWKNPVSQSFLAWVSYIVTGEFIESYRNSSLGKHFPKDIENNEYPNIKEFVIRGYNSSNWNECNIDLFIKALNDKVNHLKKVYETVGSLKGFNEFEYCLLLFFKNAYRDKNFFEAINRKIVVSNPSIIKEELEKIYSSTENTNINPYYCNHLKMELMSYFKDICVQYLGYDSLEEFKPNGSVIKIPSLYEEFNFDFLANPRIISSSYPNINERFYNYLLMDWAVHRLPRYNYNEKTGIYEQEPEYWLIYQSETEQKLEKEIQSIRRLVPINERYKYFR